MEQLLTDDIEVGSSADYHDSESKNVLDLRESQAGVNSDSDEEGYSNCQEGDKGDSNDEEYISPLQERGVDVSISSSEGSDGVSEARYNVGGKKCYVS